MERSALWRQFGVEYPLHLRAACNEAADPTTRPVSREVVTGILRHHEAEALYEEILRTAGPRATPAAVVRRLAKDLRWRTIVQETVKSVADAQKLQEQWWQGFLKWLTTSCAGMPSPTEAAARIALQGAAATVGVTLALALANKTPLGVPLLVQLDQDQKQLVVDVKFDGTRTIPIELQTPASIPIQLEASALTVPVTMTGTEGAFYPLVDELKRASQSIASAVASSGARIEHAVGAIKPVDSETPKHVQALGERLQGIEKAVSQDRKIQVELGPAAEQLKKTAFSLTALTAVAARGHMLTTFTAVERATVSGQFDVLDWTGQPTTCELSITPGEIGRTVVVRNIAGSCRVAGATVPLVHVGNLPPLRRGGVILLKSQDQRIGLSVVVDDIDDAWMGPDSAVLRVVAGTLPDGMTPSSTAPQ